MKVYLLIDNGTGKVIDIYRYVDAAIVNKNKGIRRGMLKAFNGPIPSQYRIEVMEVIE